MLTGHDHAYERIKPQNGIQYFVEGSSGQLRSGDLRKGSPLTAFGNDTDQTFMLMEIDGDNLTFNAINRQRHRDRLRRRSRGGSSAPPATPSRPPCFLFFCQSDSNTACMLADDAAVLDDDADLAPALQLQLAQALAADERGRGRRG